MVFFNHATRQMTTKIVYYGPGLCGKTTNLNTIYTRTSQKARGEMVSLNTETDRTLFFDLLPMDVGIVGGFKTKLQLYTVPGQVFYNSTRKLVLKGVDGIVFVADSQIPMLDANRESLQNLRDNLRELGLELQDIPLIFQWNKRDLKNIVPVETLERELNPGGAPTFQSIAQDGTGVFEALRGITRLALANIKALHMAEGARPAPAPEAVAVRPEPAPEALKASEFSMPADLRAKGGPEALDSRDLGPSMELYGEDPPAAPPRPLATSVQVMAPLRVRLASAMAKGAPAAPRVVLRPPVVAPHPKAPPPPRPAVIPVQALAPHAQAHVPAAVGEALQVVLSPFALDGELEVVVSVRQNGHEVGTASLARQAPPWGASGLVSVEIRRA